jgi:hypothetical protein
VNAEAPFLLQAESIRAGARRVRIDDGSWRDVYLDTAGFEEPELHRTVCELETCGLRAVDAWNEGTAPRESDVRRVMGGCSALVMRDAGVHATTLAVRVARELVLPVLTPQQVRNERWPAAVAPPAYTFMAVRIHDDFAQVRQAIAVAAELELGVPCVYFEDPRVVTDAEGVRERTVVLIRGATLFIADLSHSPSSPSFDSPNTAHEIGVAQALGLPLLVCARAPRRNLYFLAGDLETLFWRDEADLHERVRSWLRPRRAELGRRVIAYSVPGSRLRAPAFAFVRATSYRGPLGVLRSAFARLAAKVDPRSRRTPSR